MTTPTPTDEEEAAAIVYGKGMSVPNQPTEANQRLFDRALTALTAKGQRVQEGIAKWHDQVAAELEAADKPNAVVMSILHNVIAAHRDAAQAIRSGAWSEAGRRQESREGEGE